MLRVTVAMCACHTTITVPVYQPAELARMDEIGLAEPALRRPYPRVDPDPAAHFHNWLTVGAVDGED